MKLKGWIFFYLTVFNFKEYFFLLLNGLAIATGFHEWVVVIKSPISVTQPYKALTLQVLMAHANLPEDLDNPFHAQEISLWVVSL
jgi:hypothetical protein